MASLQGTEWFIGTPIPSHGTGLSPAATGLCPSGRRMPIREVLGIGSREAPSIGPLSPLAQIRSTAFSRWVLAPYSPEWFQPAPVSPVGLGTLSASISPVGLGITFNHKHSLCPHYLPLRFQPPQRILGTFPPPVYLFAPCLPSATWHPLRPHSPSFPLSPRGVLAPPP